MGFRFFFVSTLRESEWSGADADAEAFEGFDGERGAEEELVRGGLVEREVGGGRVDGLEARGVESGDKGHDPQRQLLLMPQSRSQSPGASSPLKPLATEQL